MKRTSLGREEAEDLVRRIQNLEFLDDDEAEYEHLEALKRGLGCEHIATLIFHSDPELSPAEIVAKALPVPLPAMCIAPLRWHRMRQASLRERAGEKWMGTGYVFTTRTGRPVEPRNVYRSFTRVAQAAGLRVIRLHDARHGSATCSPPPGLLLAP